MRHLCSIIGHRWFVTSINVLDIGAPHQESCRRCGDEKTVPARLEARAAWSILKMHQTFSDLERRQRSIAN